MFEEQLQHLLGDWKKSFGQYHSLKSCTEKTIVRWEWTTRERYSSLPFHFERFPGRGRVLKNGPTPMGNYIQYGFDGQGRVQLHRAYQYRPATPKSFLQSLITKPNLSNGLYSETFYSYLDGQIEIIEYSVFPYIPLSIQQIFMENGRVVFYGYFRLNGYTPLFGKKGKNPDGLYEWLGPQGRFKTAEAYGYDENRLRMISGYYEFPGIPPYATRELFAYDEAGKLLRIDRAYEDGQKQVVYRKRPKGQTFQAIRKEATQKLVEAIIQRLKTANLQEKVFCVVLNYQHMVQNFPPAIIPVPERYRLQAIPSSDPGARYSSFSSIIDHDWFLEIEDPETLEMCQILEQEIRAGEKWDAAISILRDVAAALTVYDWSHILNVTPDFVVIALDPELEGDHI